MLQIRSASTNHCQMSNAEKENPGPNYGLLRNLVSLLILVIMVVWFTDDVLRSGKVPFFRDLSTYFYPAKLVLARSFQAGEIPFWSKQLGMGFPFLANPQSAVFYPPNLVFALLPFFSAVRFLFVAHYLVGATGAYMLCLRWGISRPLALLGANLFAFGGVIVSLSNLMDHFQTAVWMPWVLYFIDRCVYRLSRRNFVILVLFCVMQFLAGSPEIWLMTVCLGFLVGIRARANGEDVSFGRVLLVLCGAHLIAAGLAMIQIIPSLELFLESWRSETIPYGKASAWSIDPWRLINFFFLDKEVNLHAYNGLSLFLAKEPPFLLSLYLGAIAPPGILLWMTKSSSREKAVVLGLVLGTLLLAMGSYVPLHRILFDFFPVLGRMRFPEKFLFLTFALLWYMTLNGITMLAGRGNRRPALPLYCVCRRPGSIPERICFLPTASS
jgi:hypothetical protein